MMNEENTFHVAWIPSKFAIVNRHIEIKLGEEWRSFTVKETWGTKDAKVVEQRGHDSTKGFGSVVK